MASVQSWLDSAGPLKTVQVVTNWPARPPHGRCASPTSEYSPVSEDYQTFAWTPPPPSAESASPKETRDSETGETATETADLCASDNSEDRNYGKYGGYFAPATQSLPPDLPGEPEYNLARNITIHAPSRSEEEEDDTEKSYGKQAGYFGPARVTSPYTRSTGSKASRASSHLNVTSGRVIRPRSASHAYLRTRPYRRKPDRARSKSDTGYAATRTAMAELRTQEQRTAYWAASVGRR